METIIQDTLHDLTLGLTFACEPAPLCAKVSNGAFVQNSELSNQSWEGQKPKFSG